MKVTILFNRSEGYEEYPGANIEAELPKKKRRRKKKTDMEAIADALRALGHEPSLLAVDGRPQTLTRIARDSADLYFNLVESYGGDDKLVELDLSKLPEGMPRIAGYEVNFDVRTEAYRKTKSAPARDLDEETTERIQQAALTAYQALKLRDYGRIDLRLAENGRVYVIEANPNPWLDPTAEFAMATREGGRSYNDTIGEIVELAMRR